MAGPWYIVVNGSEVDIDTTYGTYTTGMVGFGMPPLTHNVYEQSLTPGAMLQSIKVQPRVLQLSIGCRGATLAAYHSLRKLLVNACKPNYGGTLAPVELRYDGAGTKVKVFGYYDAGLEGQRGAGAKTPEIIALRFICYDPWFYAMSTTTETLDSNKTIANADYIVRRNSGVWSNISTDFNAAVWTIVEDKSSNIYIGGGFTNVGDAAGDFLVKWNPATEALSSYSFALSDDVRAIAVTANNSLFIGGDFTDLDTAAGDRAVSTVWNNLVYPLDSGIGSGSVYAFAVGQNNLYYAGGTFTNHADGNGDYISQWNFVTLWSSMGTGMNGAVYDLAVGVDGTLYATGAFTTAGGVAAVGIAQWNGTAWSAVGSGVGLAGGVATGYTLAIGPDGSLYVGGAFTSVDGVSANRVARWNGTTWGALGDGFNDECADLAISSDGLLYAVGSFTSAGGIDLPDRIAFWNGTIWLPVDINLPGANIRHCLLVTGNDLYIGYEAAGTAYGSGNTTVTNSGTAVAYPTITINRDGGTTAQVQYLKNETTGHVLYMDYSLLDGETLTIALTPGAKSITSSFFGNVIGRSLLPSSDFAEWCLQPGDNVISLYVYEAGSPTVTASMAFVAAHWSLDGVAA